MSATSILGLVGELEIGSATPKSQRAAALILASIIERHRLPRFPALRARGQKRRELKPPRHPEIDGDWPDNYEILTVLKAGHASGQAQRCAACFIIESIVALHLDARAKHERPGRPRNTLKLVPALVNTVDHLADAYFRRGSRRPVENALEEIASLHERRDVATVRQLYKEEMRVVRPRYAAFAVEVDGFLGSKDAPSLEDCVLDQALRDAAGRWDFFCAHTGFMLKAAYSRGRRRPSPDTNYSYLTQLMSAVIEIPSRSLRTVLK